MAETSVRKHSVSCRACHHPFQTHLKFFFCSKLAQVASTRAQLTTDFDRVVGVGAELRLIPDGAVGICVATGAGHGALVAALRTLRVHVRYVICLRAVAIGRQPSAVARLIGAASQRSLGGGCSDYWWVGDDAG
jgi:hypothetical protein